MPEMERKTTLFGNVKIQKAVFIGSISIFACILFFMLIQAGIIRPSNRYLERLIDAPFPNEATQIRATTWGGFVIPDYWYHIRFKLPSENLHEFLNQTCFLEEGISDDYPPRYDPLWDYDSRIPWWKPQDATIHEGGKCINYHGGVIIELYVDETDPDLYIIYMFAYTT